MSAGWESLGKSIIKVCFPRGIALYNTFTIFIIGIRNYKIEYNLIDSPENLILTRSFPSNSAFSKYSESNMQF